MFAVVGLLLVVLSQAATPVANFEAEAGTKSGNVTQITDATASAGSAVTFGASGGFQYNCIVKPSDCGYPDETNTGVPDGTQLTNSGDVYVTQDGTVIQNLNVTGFILIRADNVTIRNTRITSSHWYPIDYDNSTGLVIEDSEIIGTGGQPTAGVSFKDYIARRVEVRGTADGFKAEGNVLIEDCYFHSPSVTEGSHNDGVQTSGGAGGVILRHNTFKLGGEDAEILQAGNESRLGNPNWTIENNLFDGGGWVINSAPTSGNSNWIIRDNRITRAHVFGVGFVYGATIWENNYYDNDGSLIPND